MSAVDRILRTFASLKEGERDIAMKALSDIMREGGQQAKKKVNGFMGYRSYYSALFSQLPQKDRSPFIKLLWEEDPFHNEWDFMCAVYSAIRVFLEKEKISLRTWMSFAVGSLGIIPQQDYMKTLGWRLVQLENGTHQLQRTNAAPIKHCLQPINGLGLFEQCLANGLPISNPEPISLTLSNPIRDVICMNTMPAASTGIQEFRGLMRNRPSLALSALFPESQSLMGDGLEVHRVDRIPQIIDPNSSHRTNPPFLGPEKRIEVNNAPLRVLAGSILDPSIFDNPEDFEDLEDLGDSSEANQDHFDLAMAADVDASPSMAGYTSMLNGDSSELFPDFS
ncbi:mating-type protein MAT alpha 1-domain-containing protein [Bombardia bombarda]|uniref:Mating-type protein MAT alpha 1-domain-containing protein n=1 Tax=Bombardia bombarda TaxID=252184 RepID=A0AA39TIG6_9PEZI|nr:mating-type protein MAT alpha 1-domain-containing protein [Bombardia bombarda]